MLLIVILIRAVKLDPSVGIRTYDIEDILWRPQLYLQVGFATSTKSLWMETGPVCNGQIIHCIINIRKEPLYIKVYCKNMYPLNKAIKALSSNQKYIFSTSLISSLFSFFWLSNTPNLNYLLSEYHSTSSSEIKKPCITSV